VTFTQGEGVENLWSQAWKPHLATNRVRPGGDPNGGPPGRRKENSLEDPSYLPPTLKALGIPRWQSFRWQAEARQRQKEAGKQGGRGKKKNLAETILQGFPRYERETDTQLARASGEKTLPQKIAEGFPKKKPLGQKCPKGFRPYQGGRGKKRNPPQFFGEGFRSAEGPTSHPPGSQQTIEAMRTLPKRFSP
jgi:hypothetical protein